MKNDSVEFSFQDLGLEVVTLEETIRDDEMKFKAKMRNGIQIKEVELRMTISEENNNPPKAEKQEYYEQGTILNPIKLEEDNELNYEEEFDLGEQATIDHRSSVVVFGRAPAFWSGLVWFLTKLQYYRVAGKVFSFKK